MLKMALTTQKFSCSSAVDLNNEAEFLYKFSQFLLLKGVTEIVFCAGLRNLRFFQNLSSHPFTLYNHFEERSAAFFALGRARLKKQPVAVITTSGTAAGELLPACMEAFYSETPLVLITCDRPKRVRYRGTPQTAIQNNLFGVYAKESHDIDGKDSLNDLRIHPTQPTHINLCLEDPTRESASLPLEEPSLLSFFHNVKAPIALVGELPPTCAKTVESFLVEQNIPCYLESLSGLKNLPSLKKNRFYLKRNPLEAALLHGYPVDGILRLGLTPTTSFWRDADYGEIPLLSLTHSPWAGSERGGHYHDPHYAILSRCHFDLPFERAATKWLQEESLLEEKTFFKTQKASSERGALFRLLEKIPDGATLFCGNSSPIRHLDAHPSFPSKNISLYASRGLNGIDGQISTFLGVAEENRENWAIFGDLTFLYDIAGFFPACNDTLCYRVVVLNNQGGKIFTPFSQDARFLNAHTLSFKAIADLWGWEYLHIDSNTTEIPSIRAEKCLIEIVC